MGQDLFRQKHQSGAPVTNAGQIAARQRDDGDVNGLTGNIPVVGSVPAPPASPKSTKPLELAEVGRTGSPLDQHTLASNPNADKATLNRLAQTTKSDVTQLQLIHRPELDAAAVNLLAKSSSRAVRAAAKDRPEYTPATVAERAERALNRVVRGTPDVGAPV